MLYLHAWAMQGYWGWSQPLLAAVRERAAANGGLPADDGCCIAIQHVDYASVRACHPRTASGSALRGWACSAA